MLDAARPPLSAELIAQKALEIVDHDGYDALSFRVLGRAVGCEAMSLYHYFGSKAELRDALIARVMAEAAFGAEDQSSWTDQIVAAAGRLWSAFLAHPALVPVIACEQAGNEAVTRWRARFDEIAETEIPDPVKRAERLGMVWNFIIGSSLARACGPVAAGDAAYQSGLTVLMSWIAAEASRERVQSIREARRARRRGQPLQ